MPYTQEATTRTHYKRLTKYIRLVDYILMDSKLELISKSIDRSLKVVRRVEDDEPLKNRMQQTSLFEI